MMNVQTGPPGGRRCGPLSGANHLLFYWKPKFNLGDLMEEQRKYAIPHREWHLDLASTEFSTGRQRRSSLKLVLTSMAVRAQRDEVLCRF
jgi:hypothetical protein